VRAAGSDALALDGKPLQGKVIDLVDDGASHVVDLQVARRQEAANSAVPGDP
jgi:hypothetical protein